MELPSWALRYAQIDDRAITKKFMAKHSAQVVFADRPRLKNWMKQRGWPRSLFGLESTFLKQMLASDERFNEAIVDQVVEIKIPVEYYVMSKEDLQSFDEAYQNGEYDAVVAGLKEYRRAIDAGVTLEIEFKKYTSTAAFYTWAHNRYHRLEEMADSWLLSN
ncbi:MAG: hypothetical protein KDC57_09580 [Saprospiraceae bacterium]|nr:hypothetical protein [Saprospiraceae bacterium]